MRGQADTELGLWALKYGGGHRLATLIVVSVDFLLLAVFMHFYPPRMPTSILHGSLHLGELIAMMSVLLFVFTAKKERIRYGNLPGESGRFLRNCWQGSVAFVAAGVVSSLIVAVVLYVLSFFWASWFRMGLASLAAGILLLYRWRKTAKAAAEKQRADAAAAKADEELRKQRQEEAEAYAKKQAEEAEQQAVAAVERREAAKSEALSKFDASAVNGAIERVHFREALLPYVKELIAQAPLEAKCREAFPNQQLLKVVLPILDGSKEDVSHILDCDKLLELLFALIDSNQNGSVDRLEMEAMIDELCKLVTDEGQLQAALPGFAFKFVDRNKNGKLDLDEANFLLEAVLQLLGFAITTSLSLAIRVTECPLVGDEAATFVGDIIGMSEDFVRDEFEQKLKETRPAGEEQFGNIFGRLGPEPVMKFVVSAVGVLKVLHQGAEASEGDLLTKVVFSGYEWLKGGIDVETFVRFLAPMMKERVMTKPDLSKLKLAVEESFKSVEGQGELVAKIEAALEKNWAMMERSILAAQSKAAEVVPDFCRLLFRLLDIDGNGTISQREICILREIFHCVITQSAVAAVHASVISKQDLPEAVTKELRELCPEAFVDVADGEKAAHLASLFFDAATKVALGGFDVLDRNADSRVSRDEIGQLAVKFCSVGLQLLNCCWQAYFAAATAFSSDALKAVWTQAGITEVSLEELPVVLATLPSVLQAAVCP